MYPQSADTDDFTEKFIRNISKNIGAEWEKLATFLDISHDTVAKLKRDHIGTEERIFQMLLVFKKRSREEPRGLPDQLENALRTIGRVDLALYVRREVKQQHSANSLDLQQENPPPPIEDVVEDNDAQVLNIDEPRPEGESQSQSTGDVASKEQEACKELSFNIIQSLFVPCILKKIQENSKRNCYGCKLPIYDDVSQTNHECMMDTLQMKVNKYFDDALDEIVDSDLRKFRSEWNKKAEENERIVNQFPTLHSRNRIFTSYVDERITKSHAVLFDICFADGY